MTALNIFKVTNSNGNVRFINAYSMNEARMKAMDQTGEEFQLYGLPETIEQATEDEIKDTEWYNNLLRQNEYEAELEIFGY